VLAAGQATIEELGPVVDPGTVAPMMVPLVEPDGLGGVLGEVLWIDHFGNAQTNVSPADLGSLGIQSGYDVSMLIAGIDHTIPWCTAYGDVALGDGLIHVDSYGQIAIAVRGGRADEEYPLSVRTAVGFRPSGTTRIPITSFQSQEP